MRRARESHCSESCSASKAPIERPPKTLLFTSSPPRASYQTVYRPVARPTSLWHHYARSASTPYRDHSSSGLAWVVTSISSASTHRPRGPQHPPLDRLVDRFRIETGQPRTGGLGAVMRARYSRRRLGMRPWAGTRSPPLFVGSTSGESRYVLAGCSCRRMASISRCKFSICRLALRDSASNTSRRYSSSVSRTASASVAGEPFIRD